jgi:hypothetical protein
MSTTDQPELLQIPPYMRKVEDVLAVAGRLNLRNIVLMAEDEHGMILLSAGDGAPLSSSTMLWLIESARFMLMRPEQYECER